MIGRPARYTHCTELNEAGEFRARLPLGDPRIGVHRPRELTEPGRAALYVERDGVLVRGGVIRTVKYTSADQHLELGAAGFPSCFDHRRDLPAGFDPALVTSPSPTTTSSPSPRRTPAATSGSAPSPRPAPGSPAPWSTPAATIKSTGEALREPAGLADGPDFLFGMAHGSGGRPVRRLRVGTPRLGRQGTPHVCPRRAEREQPPRRGRRGPRHRTPAHRDRGPLRPSRRRGPRRRLRPLVLPELTVRADTGTRTRLHALEPHSARRPPAPSRPPRPSTSPRNPPRPAHPGPNSRFRR
ncbi:hypothetical protein QFZ22_007808 [Streptomyces canus]|uniref:Uncharacterized protein n=1 Tax=Streptomyces canus TaxID=58343 RepID=A0AAW8FQJ3_9ACTN|nr:hypothetical protein [Streptomyces canus]